MLDDAGTDLQGSTSFVSIPPRTLLASATSKYETNKIFTKLNDPTSQKTSQENEPLDSASPMTSPTTMNYANSSSDDDFFTLKPPIVHPIRRRRSSHIERWIEDQQTNPLITPKSPTRVLTQDAESQLTVDTSNAHNAYPQLSRLSLHLEGDESILLQSTDVVEGLHIPESEPEALLINQDASEHTSPPPSPIPVGRQSPNIVLHAPSLRNFHLSFRSNSPSISITESTNQSRNPSRISLFRRTARASAPQHARTSSSPTLYLSPPGVSHSPESSISGPRTRGSNWRWRPSVLGHFSSPSEPGVYVPNNGPRASTSSTTITFTSTPSGTTDLTDQMSFVSSVRSRAQTPFKHRDLSKTASPTPSVWSLPRQHQPPNVPSGSSSTPALVDNTLRLRHKPSTIRLPFTHKHKTSEPDTSVPRIVYSPSHSSKGSLPRVSFSSPGRKKKQKKLVISGIKAEETRRFEAAKRWCEGFGEVDHITRMPNGDLHVHFRKYEVADTVCRVRAKVNITGVGSVYLSWYTGNKP